MDEVGPRTSKRAAVYTARNIDHPAPAVPVIYILTKEEKKDERNERKRKNEEDTRNHANIIVDLGNTQYLESGGTCLKSSADGRENCCKREAYVRRQ